MDRLVRVMLDREKFIDKESAKNKVGTITNRIGDFPVDITVTKLAQEIASGRSFVPSYLGERNELNRNGKIARRISNWTSQQVLCLDFDNEKSIIENGKKKKIKLITMEIEQAITEFKDSAAFIYTSLSHTVDHPKFRVVFILEQPVTEYRVFEECIDNLLDAYPDADQSCRDGSRLFFGGGEFIEIGFDNRLVPRWSDDTKSHIIYNKKGFCVHVISKVVRSSYNVDNKTPLTQNKEETKGVINKDNILDHLDSNIQLIRLNRLDELRERIGESAINRFAIHEEVYEYLKTRDLNSFLGKYGKFHCIFHKDGDPSANIYINSDTSHFMYTCHSESCTFKSGTIIKCVERLLRCNKVEALRFLKKIYGVEYYETVWQREQKEIIDENIRYIRSCDFEKEYPIQYKLVKPYIDDLHTFLILARDNLPPQEYFEDQKSIIFYTTMKQFARLKGYKDPRRLVDRLALFAYLCYIHKLKEEEIPNKLLNQAKRELHKKKVNGSSAINISSFFNIQSYSDEELTRSEEYAKAFYDNHLTMSNWGREMIYRTFGKEEADRVYPQLSRKKLSEVSDEHVRRIELEIMNALEYRGYTVEDDIVESVEFIFGKNAYKKKQLKVAIGEILEKYGLQRVRLNGKLKVDLGYSGKGYPFVIIKNDKS